ncbi:hypothetical protein [Streptomyces phytophilus]|uniref:hypothetical protein n=1 Tax=Streptomyces phytophilus TaxID=722715 RepID=UPI00215DBC76|nr:hypothetical protein [Streptomyces phytophilus]
MPGLAKATAVLALSGLVCLGLLPGPAAAQEDDGLGGHGDNFDPGEGTPSGGSDGNGNIFSQVEIVWDETRNGPGGDGGGAVAPVSDWEPPPCWYGPAYHPEEFEKLARRVFFAMVHDPDGQDIASDFMEKYNGGKPYKNFNSDKAGEGYWWDDFYDENRKDDPAIFDCMEPWFWVDTGEPPPVEYENAVTPEVLAELAYDRLRLPRDEAALRPAAANQKVNLPTWVWLDEGTFRPVAVSASIPEIGIQATTTARPVGLHIDPGTDDAELYPEDGVCRINDDGSIGTPYTAGRSEESPPCGLTYLRSTESTGPYELTATVTWEISWTGTGRPNAVRLPDGVFDTTTEVDVAEIQTVVR